MNTPGRKTFSPAIIAALVGLFALAVVTVVVVLNSSGDSGDPNAGGGSSSSTSGDSGPSDDFDIAGGSDGGGSDGAVDGIASSDGAFSYQLPSGYEEAMDKVDVSSAVAAAYAPDSDASFPTTLIVTSEAAKGTPLTTIVTNGRDAIEKSLNTTTDDLVTSMTDIDGEDCLAFQTGDYEKNGVTLASAVVVTVHDDTAYSFIVNVKSDDTSSGGDALADLINSVSWS